MGGPLGLVSAASCRVSEERAVRLPPVGVPLAHGDRIRRSI